MVTPKGSMKPVSRATMAITLSTGTTTYSGTPPKRAWKEMVSLSICIPWVAVAETLSTISPLRT